ncbi:hypothetical protein [Paraburkholderia sediminicola]|uniref:hypothetical protein n=1 Tax=Paraburkholderia sediminicola TaxID=458836 RepID=UPI0038BA3ADC
MNAQQIVERVTGAAGDISAALTKCHTRDGFAVSINRAGNQTPAEASMEKISPVSVRALLRSHYPSTARWPPD